MSQVKIETAALVDAVSKAARIAPSKGAAFDKAGGIMIEVRPNENPGVTIRATDLDVQFTQKIIALETDGEPSSWRVASTTFSNFIAKLPLGSGQTVWLKEVLEDTGQRRLHCSSGKTRARLPFISDSDPYPSFGLFQVPDRRSASDFVSRIEQVAWACDKENAPFSGVHINGTELVATDKYKLASTPCVVEIDEPVTVPVQLLTGTIRNTGNVEVTVLNGRLYIMPDEYTLVSSVIYNMPYPKYQNIYRTDFYGSVEVNRALLIETIQRMLTVAQGERYPVLSITFTDDALVMSIDVQEIGAIDEEIEAIGEMEGDECLTIRLTPAYLLNALIASDRQDVKIEYGPRIDKLIKLSDEDDFTAWIMPIVKK